MTIRLGQDPNFYVDQQRYRSQAINGLLSAMRQRDEDKRRRAESEAQVLGSLPDLDEEHLKDFEAKYPGSPMSTYLRSKVEQNSAVNKFLSEQDRGRNEHASAREDSEMAGHASNVFSGLSSMAPMFGPMAPALGPTLSTMSAGSGRVSDEGMRSGLLSDPTGAHQGWEALSPEEKALAMSRLQGMGLGIERLAGDPLERNLQNYSPSVRPVAREVAGGTRPYSDLETATDVAAGFEMSPAQRQYREQIAADQAAGRTESFENQKKLAGIQHGYRKAEIGARGDARGERPDFTPEQTVDSLQDEIKGIIGFEDVTENGTVTRVDYLDDAASRTVAKSIYDLKDNPAVAEWVTPSAAANRFREYADAALSARTMDFESAAKEAEKKGKRFNEQAPGIQSVLPVANKALAIYYARLRESASKPPGQRNVFMDGVRYEIETILGADLDGDGQIGQPKKPKKG